MSRNELFFLLACTVAAATLSGGPMSTVRVPSVTIASLLLPPADPGATTDTSMFRHSFDHH